MNGATLFRIVAIEAAMHRLQARIDDRLWFNYCGDAEKAETKARNARTRRAIDRLSAAQLRLIRSICTAEQFEQFVGAQIDDLKKTDAVLKARQARRERVAA